ncbi:glycoside hydrolase family 127 protein [bacterium]|nr:glycoside hydrolase family 127 protein [bacterium]MBU1632964.1 glycoside hydrolase family 127 protein [bacterium]MBU1873776.1 glycoside hydrolase family 127 protein [bacterium]
MNIGHINTKKIAIIELSLAMIFLIMANSACSINKKNVDKQNLIELPYILLPIGDIQPEGWVLQTLEAMRDGMTGHLDELWEDVGPNCGWIGGSGPAWERPVYWLDGLVPLAYILNDKNLIDKSQKYIEWILKSQRDDGFFGQVEDTTRVFGENEGYLAYVEKMKQDWWPRMVALKVLESYYDATADQRVIDFMLKYFEYQRANIEEKQLDEWSHWSKTRGGENLANIYWLYRMTDEKWLLELGEVIFSQTRDWTERLESPYPEDWHVVNTGMGIKQPAIWYQSSQDKRYIDAVKHGIETLKKHHGQPSGMFSGDELLHGTNPTHGTELCAVVEYMFSLETVIQITGDVYYADILERVTYNALPTQCTDNFNARQYYQAPNQIEISNNWHNYTTQHKGYVENSFGFETGYGCCTANLHQGWPKFVRNLWYKTNDGGVAALIYSSSKLSTKLDNGTVVKFHEKTNYPFGEKIIFTYDGDNAVFPLHLRIPAWSIGATVKINDEVFSQPDSATIVKVNREWKKNDVVELHLPMKISISHWHERAASIEWGTLVFALKIGEDWKQINDDDLRPTYEVHATTPWNYGLLRPYIDNPIEKFILKADEIVSDNPWNLENAPVYIFAKAKRMESWKQYGGDHGPLQYTKYWHPEKIDAPEENIELIPYGCTTLRISEFPVVR